MMTKQDYIALEVLYLEDVLGEAIELPVGTLIMFAPGDPVAQVMKTDRGAWGVRAGHVFPRVDVMPQKYWIMPDDFAKLIPYDAGWALIVRGMIQKVRRSFGLAKKQPDRSIKPYFDIRDGMVVKLEVIPNTTPVEVRVTMRDDVGEKSVVVVNPVNIMTMEEAQLIRPYLKRT